MATHPLALAITAAHLGGEVLRSYFRDLRPAQITEKSQNDYVTAADRESEAAITSFLSKRMPGVGFLAEEGGESGGAARRWVIDPLDGTLNFLSGFPHFAVSVALVEEGRVEVGVVYDPMRDETYTAARGQGACRDGARIRVSGRAGMAGSLLTTGFPFRVRANIDSYMAIFRDVFFASGGIRRPGAAALDLAHTAAGIFDGFFEFGLAPWDIAAGMLLVEEAGGTVSNLDGEPDVFTRGNIVAASPAVHRELIGLVSRHVRDHEIRP